MVAVSTFSDNLMHAVTLSLTLAHLCLLFQSHPWQEKGLSFELCCSWQHSGWLWALQGLAFTCSVRLDCPPSWLPSRPTASRSIPPLFLILVTIQHVMSFILLRYIILL